MYCELVGHRVTQHLPLRKFLDDNFADNEDLRDYVDPFNTERLPALAHFYLIPKIHKNPVARPIVGACQCITMVMSKFLIDILQRLEEYYYTR
jgi:hypothetical protein